MRTAIIFVVMIVSSFLALLISTLMFLLNPSFDDDVKIISIPGHLSEWNAVFTERNTDDTLNDYLTDAVCRGCRHALASSSQNVRCGSMLPNPPTSEVTFAALELAASQVAAAFPYTCYMCDPQTCSAEDKTFWRYDRVAPTEAIPRIRPLLLASVPSDHRIPETVKDVTTYFKTSLKNVYPQREYVFEYNPSIVILPKPLQEKFKLVDPRRKEEPVYLASFRVSNQNYCLRPTEQKMMNGLIDSNGNPTGQRKPPPKSFLGLALLDRQLNILADTTLDLGGAGFSAVEDFRLFALNDEVYISSYDVLAPLYFDAGEGRVQISTAYGNDSASMGNVFVRDFVSCAPCERDRGYCGKNINYFVQPETLDIMAEIWPSAPHLIRHVDVQAPCERKKRPKEFTKQGVSPPQTSFATVESIYFPNLSLRHSLLTRGRGGACCISIEHQGRKVLVGIRHSKTPSQGNRLPPNLIDNHYLSQLYAFEPNPPFNIVAQSGYFCLGFGKPDEHPMTRHTNWRNLQIGTVFDCPRIHFVSGLTLSADNSSEAIIAYGVNDCYSRIIQVHVSDLKKLLFESPNGKGEE